MNQVWRAFMGNFHMDDIVGKTVNVLSRSEQNRLDNLHRPQRRKQYLLSRAMIRVALSRHYELPVSHWVLRESPGAPPLITNPVGKRLFLSLSHSADCIMLAISKQAVGLDVEYMRADRAHLKIAQRVFTPTQQKILSGMTEKEQIRYFYHLWTSKEARVKIAEPDKKISMFSTTPWAVHAYKSSHVQFDDYYASILCPLDIQGFGSYDLNSFTHYKKNHIFGKNQQHCGPI